MLLCRQKQHTESRITPAHGLTPQAAIGEPHLPLLIGLETHLLLDHGAVLLKELVNVHLHAGLGGVWAPQAVVEGRVL